jgi:hypothetical protein
VPSTSNTIPSSVDLLSEELLKVVEGLSGRKWRGRGARECAILEVLR